MQRSAFHSDSTLATAARPSCLRTAWRLTCCFFRRSRATCQFLNSPVVAHYEAGGAQGKSAQSGSLDLGRAAIVSLNESVLGTRRSDSKHRLRSALKFGMCTNGSRHTLGACGCLRPGWIAGGSRHWIQPSTTQHRLVCCLVRLFPVACCVPCWCSSNRK